MKHEIVALLTLLAFSNPAPSEACLHVLDGRLGPQYLTMVVAWDDGVEDVVIDLSFVSSTPVDQIAFVLPVPSRPTSYDVVERDDVAALRAHVHAYREAPKSQLMGGIIRGDDDGVVVLATQYAGPYEIQPIEGHGEVAATRVRAWLTDAGFGSFPAEAAAYYADRDWTFLAIRTVPGAEMQLREIPALHVRFPARRIVLPMKLLLHTQPYMDLRLYLLTSAPLSDLSLADAEGRGFEVVSETQMVSPDVRGELIMTRGTIRSDAVDPRVGRLISRFAVAAHRDLSVTYLHSEGSNTSRMLPDSTSKLVDVAERRAAWIEDLCFPPLQDGAQLFGGARMPPMPKLSAPDNGELPPWQGPPADPSAPSTATQEQPALTSGARTEQTCKGCASTGATPWPVAILLVWGLAVRRRGGRHDEAAHFSAARGGHGREDVGAASKQDE